MLVSSLIILICFSIHELLISLKINVFSKNLRHGILFPKEHKLKQRGYSEVWRYLEENIREHRKLFIKSSLFSSLNGNTTLNFKEAIPEEESRKQVQKLEIGE